MRIGYARPTLTGPSVEEQAKRLEEAGVDLNCPPAYWHDEALKKWGQRDLATKGCRQGDEFFVCSLWLLGQSREDLAKAITDIVRRGAVLRTLDGGSIISIEGMAAMAEISLAEVAWKREQTAPARKRRKAKKAEGGRPPALSNEEIEEAMTWQKDEDLTLSQIAARFDERGKKVSRTAVYESIQRYIARKG